MDLYLSNSVMDLMFWGGYVIMLVPFFFKSNFNKCLGFYTYFRQKMIDDWHFTWKRTPKLQYRLKGYLYEYSLSWDTPYLGKTDGPTIHPLSRGTFPTLLSIYIMVTGYLFHLFYFLFFSSVSGNYVYVFYHSPRGPYYR